MDKATSDKDGAGVKQTPNDDRADYLDSVLYQTAVIAADTESIGRVRKHLERHGYDGESR